MGTIGSAGSGRAYLRCERGFSLVEAMVALVAAVVVGMGMYAIFNASQRSSVSQRLRNDAQANCTFALDKMKSEMALGGYRAVNPAQPISAAAGGSITFEYWDDNATFSAPYATNFDNHTQVTYRRATAAESGGIKSGDVVREVRRYNTVTDAYETPTKQVLVDNVSTLGFNYFQADNQLWSGASLGAIRTIRVGLTCEASRPDPNTNRTSTIALSAEVRARNVGVSATPTDTTPPATPTGLVAWDPGSCGALQVRWNANTDGDLEGYTLFWGLSSGAYSRRVRLQRAPMAAGQYEYYTLTGLTSNKVGPPVSQAQYYLALQAFDKSGNLSTSLSAEATGNPSTSTRTEATVASNGTDTAIDPQLPTPPTAFAAIATPSVDGSITLSWTPPAIAELKGYRLYRGTSASFIPDDTFGTGNRIASESQLTATETSSIDTGTGLPEARLVGCQNYYYKLAPVICDTTLVATYTTAQFASAYAAPTDTTPPSNPVISARPGYRRIILTLTNPTTSGMGSDPDFVRTTVHWSKTGFPDVDPAPGAVSPSPTIPRSGGTFTGSGTLPTINFNDETSATATSPNLQPDTTYYFLAVAYDQCGNHTGVNSSSIAEGTQCGDCLLAAPAPPGTPDPDCYQAPSGQEPTGVDAEGCYGYADLTWNPIDDVVIRDFQGFRVQRREGLSWVGGTNEVNLSGDDAAWIATWQDATVEEGKAYSYRIMATDCYYEQHHGKSPADWPEAGNDPNDNFREVFLNGVAVGRPLIDPSKPQVETGALGATPPGFHHNPVKFWVRNASDTRLTLQTLTVKWENPDAWLQRLVVGDGGTTPVTTSFDEAADPLTHGFEGSTITLATTRLDPLDDQIPFDNLFLSSVHGVDRTTDMRATEIDFTLTYKNDSTGSEACSAPATSIYAPLGPYIYSVTQDKPYFGTLSWSVPGDEGFNVINAVTVPGGADVTVSADILDTSGNGIPAGSVRLYYFVDPGKTLTAAPAVTGTYPTLNYAAVTMTRVAGDQWRGIIPAVSDANVWYFILARDDDGNFDLDPEPWAGAFQYFQPPPDDCSTIPNPPAISGSTSGGNVTLNWTAPTLNATPAGTAYTDPGGFKVYRDRGDGTGWHLAFGGVIANPAATTWTDVAVFELDTLAYRYYLTAYDACAPTPNESAASNIFSELVEGVCGNTPSPPVISGVASASDSVSLSWTAPTTNEPPSPGPLVDLGGYEVWRKNLTGPFTLRATVGPATLTYLDSAADIKNQVYTYYVTAFDTCAVPGPKISPPSNTYTEPLVNNPCDEIPNPATLAGSSDSTSVSLGWTPPTHNTNGEDFRDSGGFKIWRNQDGGSFSVVATVGSATYDYIDTSVAADIGTSVYRYHVTVIDTCSTPNESAPSNVFTESYTGPCGTTPSAPALLGTSGPSSVTLVWSGPATNTDGSLYSDPGGYRVYRRRTATGSWAKIADLGAGTFTYLDTSISADIGTAAYFYYVTAVDTCPVTPNESAPSGIYSESYNDPCAGLPVPSTPGALTLGSVNCNSTKAMSLSWAASTPAPEGYRVYGCSLPDGTTSCAVCGDATHPWVLLNSAPDPLTALSFSHSISAKMNSIVWCYGIKAVNKGTCSNSALWALSPLNSNAPLIDSCP